MPVDVRAQPILAMAVATMTLLRVSAKSERDCDAFYGPQDGNTTVVCEAIRDRGPVGSNLLFTCALNGGLLSAVYWSVVPANCCSLSELYRVTQTEPKRENADVQLTLTADKPVTGRVVALVVAVGGEIVVNASMDFAASNAPEDAGCRCKRHYMWCDASGTCRCPVDRPHHDPVHEVCGKSVPLDGACRYHHQCQWNHSTLECLQGRCGCGYRAVRSTKGDPRVPCVPTARYGERCADRDACVGAGTTCGRAGRCTCVSGYKRVREGCMAPPTRPPTKPPRLLGGDRKWPQYSFYAVCAGLLALACLARVTTRAVKWLLGRATNRDQSTEPVERYAPAGAPRPVTSLPYDRPEPLHHQKPSAEAGL
ncbi:hypothetical protein HPB49_021370 [Dermacentor silvarum]|uniref:Uncharacterized protein n=1 Tax=Dermacentor silvarum TaxID=543639 RepID=A0ACB8D029_DERSI|nr:hypothetical protein HPB49_021370 [Dermacentor silvarum]